MVTIKDVELGGFKTDVDIEENVYRKIREDAFNQRENADACSECVFIDTNEWELPCAKCKRNAKDYWRARV